MSDPPPRRIGWALLPFAVFGGLALMFWKGLGGDPQEIPSALIGSEVGEFALPEIPGLGLPGLATADLKAGKVSVVNVWASWCGPCRAEHPLLMELAKRSDIALVGINYKDKPDNAAAFLKNLGQPFAKAGADEKGRAAIDWGVYGVPETFVVDGKGVIRYKWIGPLTADAIKANLGPEIEKAKVP
jgi:cytochrome c biogenesis protein CcmG, thiol:disulfide interchange protein DsbE